ncbi:MAG: C45 family peptidase, partial [Bryobacteraceae bacterium]
GGTRDWTRLSLRFVASRAEDNILLTAGSGGSFHGKAWFEGVTVDEVSDAGNWPARDAVRTFGPAYRYPAAGWIYLHIEGKPYERGFQHGYLMAKEIPEYLARCEFDLAGKSDARTWDAYRTTANALFLRGFDREILEEMRGIAEGANAGGAKWQGRKLDLVDIVLANTEVELSELAEAMPMTPTGMEGTSFTPPPYAPAPGKPKHDSPIDHCSAFAATGSATRDGKMVIGHVTWWPLTLAEQTNVMLDIKPENGHRVLMQSYPGGIESGTDWYQNDAGMVLTETTIRQTPFNAQGTPVSFRARMAIQYGGNIEEMVAQLGKHNNGLYTNEWLMGDAKNDEIAMYELGTGHSRLWRSLKNEWFGGTTGFYWGNNNAKDMAVKMELLPDPHGAPEFVPFVLTVRDLAWQDLYNKYKGKIDEQFAFTAFDSGPLVSRSTMDAKVTDAALARQMMVWANFGRPNQSVWNASTNNPGPSNPGPNQGLYPAGYYLFGAEPTETLKASVVENEKARMASPEKGDEPKKPAPVSYKDRTDQLWKGWILPATDADTWFVAGSAAYYHLLQAPDVAKAMDAQRIRYRGLKLAPDNAMTRFQLEEARGVLFLDALRVKRHDEKVGDDSFLKLMAVYFTANTTKTVTAQSFLDLAGVPFEAPDAGDGPAYLTGDIGRPQAATVIVYGTTGEAGANRYAAEREQSKLREHAQREVPIYKDFEATDALLAHRDVVFIGRPETNSALAAWAQKINLEYQAGIFRIAGKPYASERNALIFAGKNPLDAAHMVLVYAGNSPLAMAQSLNADLAEAPWIVLENGKAVGPSALPKGAVE